MDIVDKIHTISINKNRGWRGLARAVVCDSMGEVLIDTIFSFSQPVWNDLMEGYIVLQTDEEYLILKLDNLAPLPKGHQRSVLIKNYMSHVTEVNRYKKNDWRKISTPPLDFTKIIHFIQNKNNHTTSDWNCIGVRVIPEI